MGIQFSSLAILLLNDGIKRRSMRSRELSDGIYRIEESADDDDRISNLPDCVISHILSFLPTSDSMLTALLSRRWKNVWRTYVTKLSFDSTIPPFNAKDDDYDIDLESDVDVRFSGFVNRALILYDKENHLDRFHLQCLRVSKLYDVTTWLDWAIMRGVRSLDLSLGKWNGGTRSSLFSGYELPSCIFYCKTLEELKLHNVYIVAHHSCLPNLKTLALRVVRIEDQVHVPENLFPIFPRLTVLNLEAECCRWRLLFLNNSPKLVKVNILEYPHHRELSAHELCWKNPAVVPACFISSLKSMTIMGLSYSQSEIEMAKFTIENARIMRRMNISTCGLPVMKKYRHELLNLRQRGSKDCEILVEVREECKDYLWS